MAGASLEVFRYDKNFVSNLSRICEISDKGDSSLIRALLCFFSWEHQHSIFDEGILDPEKFAEDYNFSAGYLRGRHPSPYQLQDIPGGELERMLEEERNEMNQGKTKGYVSHRLWDSILENALYVLQNKPINIVTTGGYYSLEGNGSPVKGSIAIQVIKELRCFVRGRKVMYWYSLNPDFVKNLTGYFINARRDSFLRLRPKALDELYFNLTNLKANLLACKPPRHCTDEGRTPSFDTLCRWAHIPEFKKDGTPYEPKARKRDLNAAFKAVQEGTELRFSVEWKPCEDIQHRYLPVFEFSIHDCNPYALKTSVDMEFRSMFCDEITRCLATRYREINSITQITSLSEEAFYEWLRGGSHPEEKRNAFENAYYSVYKGIPSNIDVVFNDFIEQVRRGVRIPEVSLS